jgi:Tol biopolymer transport system component/DNA-binding winged helix-turn-helix (wHTH) protein
VPFVVYQFGDFSLHCGKFELCRKGRRLKLERKPLELLVLLVTKHGQVVTRDEIAGHLWEREVFVDVEHGINTAIRKIRQTLDDSSDLPQFVQTISGSGYRFIAPVKAVEPEVTEAKSGSLEATGETANGLPEEIAPIVSVQIGHAGAGGASSASLGTGRSKRLAMRFTIGAAVLAAGLGVALWYLHRPLPPPRITEYVKITRDGHEKLLGGTDGSRIYFTQFQPNSLNQVGVAGGEVVQIPAALPGFFLLLDVSPDGSNLLVTSYDSHGNSLWIVRALGGTSRRIGNGWSATFSPDGNSIAYFIAPGELWLVQSDGTGRRKLASVGGSDLHWSPDGRVIAFDRDGVLWEISADGSSLHEVLPGWQYRGQECCGRWTPDGKFYVFLTSPSARRGDKIWALDERRGVFRHLSAAPVQLTNGPINWSNPIPGKGMSKIFSNGKTSRGELCRFDPKTKQLQPFLGGVSAQDVSFSKDGQSVAYVSYPDGTLWRANRDGSNPVQLSTPPIHATNPRWSPDGSKILFGDYEEIGADRIYLVSSQGGSPQRQVPDYSGDQDDPGWSADGRKIVFAWTGIEGKEHNLHNLVVLDLATSRVTPVPGSAGLWSPRWSPDGKYIAAMSFEFQGLKVLDVATQRWSTLPVSKRMDYPAWSSDSKYIYFLRLENGDRGVYRIRATGSKAERVADLKDWHITGLATYWMALDPTDAPLLLRDVGSDDIYALTLEEK